MQRIYKKRKLYEKIQIAFVYIVLYIRRFIF